MKTYDEVTTAIMGKRRFGKASGAEVTAHILGILSNPERGMKIIQIAGTNGKGSTAAFVSSILQAAGFCVGMFTSPHLVRFNERIRVNGREIADEDVRRLGSDILNLDSKIEDTMFDDCLVMALLYFKEKGCDYVILEAGLGGRLDSTAGISETPIVTIITRIGLDHTEILGDTVEKIAAEKAGILKRGTTLVIAKNEKAAVDVIVGYARKLEIPCKTDANTSDFYRNIMRERPVLGLRGSYQRENAANAIIAVEELYNADLTNPNYSLLSRYTQNEMMEIVKAGLVAAAWAGRMEVISFDPLVILDGAHNPQGIEALSEALREEWPDRRFIFVTGMLADKDYTGMIAPLVKISERFFAADIQNTPRSLSSEKLADEIVGAGGSAVACKDAKDALDMAFSYYLNMQDKDKYAIVGCGSLYFIGELISNLAMRITRETTIDSH